MSTYQGDTEEQRLLHLFGQLNGQDRATLLAFAQFLAARNDSADTAMSAPVAPESPCNVPRPPDETVVGAIKRLSQTYYMLDRRNMLSETSSLMAAHVLQGRPTLEVITELEEVFQNHYQKYLEAWSR